MKINMCDKARVKLTQLGIEILEGDIRGRCVLKENPEIRTTLEMTLSLKSIMVLFAKHYESRPMQQANLPFVDNEIDVELGEPAPRSDCLDEPPERGA